MGLLRSYDVLKWEEIKGRTRQIKGSGVEQFMRIYHKEGTDSKDSFWGDEIELMVCARMDINRLLLCSSEVTKSFSSKEMLVSLEYAGYMVETTPPGPSNLALPAFAALEESMEARRHQLHAHISKKMPKAFPLLATCFPDIRDRFAEVSSDGLIVPELTYNITKSEAFPDNAIAKHKRFISFTENIMNRRGRKVEGYVRVMPDARTTGTGQQEEEGVLIDAMGQGMGCCCLQVTIQFSDIVQARRQYDTLGVFAPLMLRLSRATPIAMGRLLNTETRWDMLAFSVDSRTDIERGCKYERSGYGDQPTNGPIRKSRFSSIDLFLASDEYNDVRVPIVEEYKKKLVEGGVDELMARHVSSLFIRDPVLAYEGSPDTANTSVEDFENIQSSNWRSVRLKLPAGEDPQLNGWKVEFRPMEIQPTSFENAAFTIFAVLLSQATIHFNANLYIPMSLVEENFVQAGKFARSVAEARSETLPPDSVEFNYRANIFEAGPAKVCRGTIAEIFNGKGDYCGLVGLARRYVDQKFPGGALAKYIDFIADKASGKYISVSEYLRRFVLKHPQYRSNSVVEGQVLDDLVDELRGITEKNDFSYLLNHDLEK